MSPAEKLLVIYLVLANVITFAAYGMDKYKAKKNKWRIPESSLILSAFLGGALGAFAGMKIFRHKTLHTQFRILIPLALILWIVIAGWIFLQKGAV